MEPGCGEAFGVFVRSTGLPMHSIVEQAQGVLLL